MKWLLRYWHKNIIVKELIELFGDELNRVDPQTYPTPVLTCHAGECNFKHPAPPRNEEYCSKGNNRLVNCSHEEEPDKCLFMVSRPECPICFEYFTLDSTVYQCAEGHLYCDVCKKKMKNHKCPQCLIPISKKGIRNRFLEFLLQSQVGMIETQCDLVEYSNKISCH